MADAVSWRRLCGMAVELVGSQDQFRKESNILKRIVRQFGAAEVEHMILGAQRLGWTSLRGLGSADGLGRRWALQSFWTAENHKPTKLPERLKAILRSLGDP